MNIEVIAAVAAVALALVGLVGVVFPVLPGSITVAVGALVWALWGGSTWGWIAFGIAAALLLAGALSSWLLTGRSLQQREVPKWPIAVGLLLGVVGMFVLPGFGLPIGFVIGLLVAEWYRVRNLRNAVVTSWATITALGLGIIVELLCAMAATALIAVSVATAW